MKSIDNEGVRIRREKIGEDRADADIDLRHVGPDRMKDKARFVAPSRARATRPTW